MRPTTKEPNQILNLPRLTLGQNRSRTTGQLSGTKSQPQATDALRFRGASVDSGLGHVNGCGERGLGWQMLPKPKRGLVDG